MPATRRACLRLLIAGFVLVLAAALWDVRAAETPAAKPAGDDPFPIQRVVLSVEKIPAELERARKGALVRLPRAEFEKKVRAAAATPGPPPQLVETHYRAKLLHDRLDENALEGTAEWKLTNPGAGPGVLHIANLQLALRQARWTNNKPAVLGILEPGAQANLALLVERPGEQSLLLDWSARGVPEAGEMRFDLAVPAASIATIELEVPAALSPTFPQDEVAVVAASGPGDEGHRSWKLAFGGLTHLEVVLRPAAAENATPALQVASRTQQDLSAGLLTHHTTLDFRTVRGEASSFYIEYDPDLTINDVEAPGLQSWQPLPGMVRGHKRLSVKLGDPAASGQVRVAATAPLPSSEAATWTSPQVRLADATVTGDTLRLRKSADISFVELKPGTYRLAKNEFGDDRSQTLTFEASPLPDGQPVAVRPSALFRSTGTEFRVRQSIRWEVGERSIIDTQVSIEIVRGTLGQLNLRVPAGWDLESAGGDPRAVGIQDPRAMQAVRVEWPTPLEAGEAATIRLRFAAGRPLADLPARMSMPLPDVLPLGAVSRRGTYAVVAGRGLRVTAPFLEEEQLVGPPQAPAAPERKWTTSFLGTPPAEPLVLERVPAQLSAASECMVIEEGGRFRVTTRFTLAPTAGAPSSLTVFSSEPVAATGNWRVLEGGNRVVAVEPLPLDAAVACAARSPWWPLVPTGGSRWWQVRLAESLAAGAVIENETVVEAGPVPLLEVAGSSASARTAAVQLADGSRWQVQAGGMAREYPRHAPAVCREFYRLTGDRPSLQLVRADGSAKAIEFDTARLITAYNPGGVLRSHYRLRLLDPAGVPLAARLPPGAALLAVRVDGQPVPAEAVRFEQKADALALSIPVPARREWQHVELLYTLPAASRSGFASSKPLLPEFDGGPAIVSVEWRLPPGYLPLGLEGGWTRVDGRPDPERSILRPFRDEPEAWQGRLTSDARLNPAPSSTARTFRQMLAGTESGERPLIDSVALADAGVTPLTAAPGGTFESLGLVAVPVPGGLVLTSPRQQSLWSTTTGPAIRLAPGTAELLQEATRSGRDSTGRFRTVDDWLLAAGDFPDSLLAELGGDEPGWTAWRSTSADPAPEIRIVDGAHLSILGWLIALTLGAVTLRLMRRPRLAAVLALAWLTVAGVSLITLPDPLRRLAFGPLLTAVAALAAIILRRRQASSEPLSVVKRRPPSASGIRSRSGLGVAGALLVAVSSSAFAPEPATVFLIAGPKGDLVGASVLAPPELLERLDDMANKSPPLADAAFLRVRYAGRSETGESAEFEGQFDIALFADAATVPLPLGDVRLREVLVDGAAAFPKAHGNDRFAIAVKGKGEHRVRVKFSATVGGSEAERDLKFQTPETPCCRLEFAVPPGVEQVRAVNWRGAQAYSAGSRTLTADLGRTRNVQVRWRTHVSEEAPASRVSEISLWDVDPAIARLRSVLDYRVTRGNVTSLKVQMPPGLQVSRVEVRPETVPVGGPPAWVRDWGVADNVLKVDLQNALTGNVRLTIDATAGKPVTTRPVLQAPRALGATESESLVAYRLSGLVVANDADVRGVQPVSAGTFLKDWWRPLGVEKSPGPVTRAYRRDRGQNAFLRPLLQVAPLAGDVRQELTWTVGPKGADLRATGRWAGEVPMTFATWEVPAGLTVLDVEGSEVHSWLRSGNRVQAWFREPVREAAVAWRAAMPAGKDGNVFESPPIRVEGAASTTAFVRLRLPAAWVAWPEAAPKKGPPADAEAAAALEVPDGAARFQLRRGQSNASFKITSVIRAVDRQLVTESTIEPSLRRDRPHSFVITATDTESWSAGAVDAPGCVVHAIPGPAGRREWRVEVPARERDGLAVRITFALPLEAPREARLPQVGVVAGESPLAVRKTLELVGENIRAAELQGWQPGEPNVWQSALTDTRAKVVASPVSLRVQPSVEIALAEVALAATPGRYVQRASIELSHQPGASLDVILPLRSKLEGWCLEGNRLEVHDGDRLPVPLPAAGGSRLLQLVWSSDRSNMDLPRFEAGGRAVAPRTVLRSASARGPEAFSANGEASAAYLHLSRAEALLKLADESPDEAERRRLMGRALRWVRYAQANLAGPRSASWNEERSPSGLPLSEWAAKLRERAGLAGPRPAQPQAGPPRDDSWELLPFGDLFREGVPVRWVSAANIGPPKSKGGEILFSLANSAIFLIGAGLLGLLMLVGGRHTRPEQVAVLCLLGLLGVGLPLGLFFLAGAAAAVGYRVLATGTAMYRWASA